jgi:hypothetical protein
VARNSIFTARSSTFPARNSNFVARNSLFTARISTFPARNSKYLARISTFPARISKYLARISTFPARISKYLARNSNFVARSSRLDKKKPSSKTTQNHDFSNRGFITIYAVTVTAISHVAVHLVISHGYFLVLLLPYPEPSLGQTGPWAHSNIGALPR